MTKQVSSPSVPGGAAAAGVPRAAPQQGPSAEDEDGGVSLEAAQAVRALLDETLNLPSFEDNATLFIVSLDLPVHLHQPHPDAPIQVSPSNHTLLSTLYQLKSLSPSLQVKFVGLPNLQPQSTHQQAQITRLLSSYHCIPVFAPSPSTLHAHNNFCQLVLWPLFNNVVQMDGVQVEVFDQQHWFHYQNINKVFADVVSRVAQDTKDLVWVHDYPLLLVPQFLMRRLRLINVGLFLHSSFPSSELFRTLPVREEILRGMLCADLIGFQFFEYARHFLVTAKRVLGVDYKVRLGGLLQLDYAGRNVCIRVGHAFLDPNSTKQVWQEEKDKAVQLATEWRNDLHVAKNKFVFASIDRCDMLSGVIPKLQAFQEFLRENPHLTPYVTLVQFVYLPKMATVASDSSNSRQAAHAAAAAAAATTKNTHKNDPSQEAANTDAAQTKKATAVAAAKAAAAGAGATATVTASPTAAAVSPSGGAAGGGVPLNLMINATYLEQVVQLADEINTECAGFSEAVQHQVVRLQVARECVSRAEKWALFLVADAWFDCSLKEGLNLNPMELVLVRNLLDPVVASHQPQPPHHALKAKPTLRVPPKTRNDHYDDDDDDQQQQQMGDADADAGQDQQQQLARELEQMPWGVRASAGLVHVPAQRLVCASAPFLAQQQQQQQQQRQEHHHRQEEGQEEAGQQQQVVEEEEGQSSVVQQQAAGFEAVPRLSGPQPFVGMVLSENAGVSRVLNSALKVNPMDSAMIKHALHAVLNRDWAQNNHTNNDDNNDNNNNNSAGEQKKEEEQEERRLGGTATTHLSLVVPGTAAGAGVGVGGSSSLLLATSAAASASGLVSAEESRISYLSDAAMVECNSTAQWAEAFLGDLWRAKKRDHAMHFVHVGLGAGFRVMGMDQTFACINAEFVRAQLRRTRRRAVFLDYEGTLAPHSANNYGTFLNAVAAKHPHPPSSSNLAQNNNNNNNSNSMQNNNNNSSSVHNITIMQNNNNNNKDNNNKDEAGGGGGPSEEVKGRLRALCADPRNVLVVVMSRRDKRTLDAWFGDVHSRLGLCAEYGYEWKTRFDAPWKKSNAAVEQEQAKKKTTQWKSICKDIMSEFVVRTPGSFIENRGSAFVFQYKAADEEFGLWQAKELHDHLSEFLREHPVDIVSGKGYVEVRLRGVSKGKAVEDMIKASSTMDQPTTTTHHDNNNNNNNDNNNNNNSSSNGGIVIENGVVLPDFILCVGDGRSDEDAFHALHVLEAQVVDYWALKGGSVGNPEDHHHTSGGGGGSAGFLAANRVMSSKSGSVHQNLSRIGSSSGGAFVGHRRRASTAMWPAGTHVGGGLAAEDLDQQQQQQGGLVVDQEVRSYLSVSVGRKPSAAKYFVHDVSEVHALLDAFAVVDEEDA